MTEDQIRDYLDSLITEHGGSTICEPHYAPVEPLEFIVDEVSAVSGISASGMMACTFQELRNAY